MAKTVSLRIDDHVYELFQKAAAGARRNLSNFIEYATLAYLVEEMNVSDEEMEELLNNKAFLRDIKKGLKDRKEGRIRIVG